MAIRLSEKLVRRVLRPSGPVKSSTYHVVIPLKAILAMNGDKVLDQLKGGNTYELVADTDINPWRCIVGVHYNPMLVADADAPAYLQLLPVTLSKTLGLRIKAKRNISIDNLKYLCYLTIESDGYPSWGEDVLAPVIEE